MKERAGFTPWRVGLLLCLLLAGCNQPAETKQRVNPNFEIERLFEHEGCTVYRFHDSRAVYYVRCRDGGRVSVQSSYWQSTGKSGYYVDVHTTVAQ